MKKFLAGLAAGVVLTVLCIAGAIYLFTPF